MNIIAIIPARMASTRLPNKPLALLHGMPMLGHVALRTQMCKSLSSCYVATCDDEIVNYCQRINIQAIMTKNTHTRCTARVAEAVKHIENSTKKQVDIVVIVQGDEPMVTAQMIDAALEPMLKNSSLQVINLMAPIESMEEFNNPNTIKVVTNKQGKALYFSRSAIPNSIHGTPPANVYKQVCIMPFKRDALFQFEDLPPTELELAESIDMLRLLEHGHNVHMVQHNTQSKCVDTAEDLIIVSKLMQNDPIMPTYLTSEIPHANSH